MRKILPMMGKTHKLGGVCAGTIASACMIQTPITTEKLILTGIVLGTSIIGSLLPDIDHTNSTMGKKHKIISKIINVLCGHRGMTHAPLFLSIIIALLCFLARVLPDFTQLYAITAVFGLAVGFASHLLLDIITINGIPLFYPFSKKHVSIARFRSQKNDGIVSLLSLLMTVIILVLIVLF